MWPSVEILASVMRGLRLKGERKLCSSVSCLRVVRHNTCPSFFSMLHLPWRALSPHSERTAHKTPNLDYLAATILSHCSSGAAWTDGTKNRCFTNRKANITPCDGWKPFWLIGFMLDCLVLLRNVHYIDFDSFFFFGFSLLESGSLWSLPKVVVLTPSRLWWCWHHWSSLWTRFTVYSSPTLHQAVFLAGTLMPFIIHS